MKALPKLVLITFLLAGSLHAEPDKLVRLLLGMNSLPVSFIPAKPDQVYQMAIAKFKDGKFIGYCELPGGITRPIAFPGGSAFHAELAWTKHDGSDGFLVETPTWSQNFVPDGFFGNALGLTRYFAKGQPSQQKLGPFSVLGLAVGGAGGPPPGNEENAAEWIKKYQYAVVFLLAPFDTDAEAARFAKSMPQLTTD